MSAKALKHIPTRPRIKPLAFQEIQELGLTTSKRNRNLTLYFLFSCPCESSIGPCSHRGKTENVCYCYKDTLSWDPLGLGIKCSTKVLCLSLLRPLGPLSRLRSRSLQLLGRSFAYFSGVNDAAFSLTETAGPWDGPA